MKLVISDDDGNTVGELYTDPPRLWRDLLLYASERWETQAQCESANVLEMILTAHADPAR